LIAFTDTIINTTTLEDEVVEVINTQSTKGSRATNPLVVFILNSSGDEDSKDGEDNKRDPTNKK
jgi:hypothetical protein